MAHEGHDDTCVAMVFGPALKLEKRRQAAALQMELFFGRELL
jgi:hypothetical protein